MGRASKRLRLSVASAVAARGLSLEPPERPIDGGEGDNIYRIGGSLRSATGAVYEKVGKLGEGTFGQVLRCRLPQLAVQQPRLAAAVHGHRAVGEGGSDDSDADLGACPRRRQSRHVALKIIKPEESAIQEAQGEVDILKLINQRTLGMDGAEHIVEILDHFSHQDHLCIALELLGPDLYQFLSAHGSPGLPLGFVRAVTAQLLAALRCLQAASVIHADLKPENVLLADMPWRVSLRRPWVKIIDFGCARTVEKFTELQHEADIEIQTLPYRAPEVLLSSPFTCAADMWSLGCIIVELVLGRPLVSHSARPADVVHTITSSVGAFTERMCNEGRSTGEFYSRGVRRKSRASPPPPPAQASGWWPTIQVRVRGFLQKLTPQVMDEEVFHELRPRERSPVHVDGDNEEGDSRLKERVQKLRPEMQRRWNLLCFPRRLTAELWTQQLRERLQFLDFLLKTLEVDSLMRWSAARASRHGFVRGC